MDIRVSFKKIWTTHIFDIYVNQHCTVTQFIDYITPILSREFDMVLLEIVETGQSHSPAELAPKLEKSDMTLASKWENQENISFYIRNYE